MDFEKRLERAIVRGQHTRDSQGREQSAKAVDQEELRGIHSSARLRLTEHIESCLRKLADHFPGFGFETLVKEEGWGARITRDDLQVGPGRRPESRYSRLVMLISPFTSSHIIELSAKGTVRNKELFNRTHFQYLAEADVDSFSNLIDLWVLEYAEQYAART